MEASQHIFYTMADSLNWRSRPRARPKYCPKRHNMRTRKAFGIMLCQAVKNKRPEVLLICKKFNYAYTSFAYGEYTNNSDILRLFNNMTNAEKFDIYSLNFNQIWSRIRLNNNHSPLYLAKKHKFDSTFLPDGGVKLRELLARSTSIPDVWEIPKGMRNSSETELDCAIRELREETLVTKDKYLLIPNRTFVNEYVDGNVRYVHKYYFAVAREPIVPRIDFSSFEQINEVSDIRWMNIDDIGRIDAHLKKFIEPVFRELKNRCSGRTRRL